LRQGHTQLRMAGGGVNSKLSTLAFTWLFTRAAALGSILLVVCVAVSGLHALSLLDEKRTLSLGMDAHTAHSHSDADDMGMQMWFYNG
jgi:hypothetical protein